jgi:hypothetical protein
VGGAGGGGGFPAVEVLVGLVVGAGGGTLRPVVPALGTGGLGALLTPPGLSIELLVYISPFATGGLGPDTTVGPFGKVGLLNVGLLLITGDTGLAAGPGRRAGAGGGAGGAGLGAGISSLR